MRKIGRFHFKHFSVSIRSCLQEPDLLPGYWISDDLIFVSHDKVFASSVES